MPDPTQAVVNGSSSADANANTNAKADAKAEAAAKKDADDFKAKSLRLEQAAQNFSKLTKDLSPEAMKVFFDVYGTDGLVPPDEKAEKKKEKKDVGNKYFEKAEKLAAAQELDLAIKVCISLTHLLSPYSHIGRIVASMSLDCPRVLLDMGRPTWAKSGRSKR